MIVMQGITVQDIVTDKTVGQETIVQEIVEQHVKQDTHVQEEFDQIVVSGPYTLFPFNYHLLILI